MSRKTSKPPPPDLAHADTVPPEAPSAPVRTLRWRATVKFEGEEAPRDLILYADTDGQAIERMRAAFPTKVVLECKIMEAGHVDVNQQLMVPATEVIELIDRQYPPSRKR